MTFIEDTTKIKSNIEETVQILKGRLAYLEQNKRVVDALPETDEFAEGAVLTFDKQFRNTDNTETKVYNYTAIKTPAGWSISGRTTQVFSWEAFVDFLVDDGIVLGVWLATTTEQIA